MVIGVGDVVAIVNATVSLIRLIDDAFNFYKECRDLKARCEAIKSILQNQQDVFIDNTSLALDGLGDIVQAACRYLNNKRIGWLYRNPFMERVFFLRIEKFEKKLDSWIVTLNLSVSTSTLAVTTAQRHMLADSLKLGSKEPIPIIRAEDIETAQNTQPGVREFSGKLKTGDPVRFVPIRKDSTQKQRILSTYRALSGTASIQKLHGLYRNENGEYAVMEELEGPESPFVRLDKALAEGNEPSVAQLSRNQRILLCREISLVVLYLHSHDFVVKIISDQSIFVRKDQNCLVPIFTNLEQARSIMMHTEKFSYDQRYDPPEYGLNLEGKSQEHNSGSDVWSLGLLLWQILTVRQLPASFKVIELMAAMEHESTSMKTLIGACLNISLPSKRPRSSEIAARLLDEYNDSTAKEKVGKDVVLDLLSRSRQLIHNRRRDHSTPHHDKISQEDVNTLIGLRDSWDEAGSDLRLAPEVSFLLGAGIYWNLVDVNNAQVPYSVVGRGTGPRDEYKTRLAIYYLTEAIDMGYSDGAFELMKAHASLSKLYSQSGGTAINSKLIGERVN